MSLALPARPCCRLFLRSGRRLLASNTVASSRAVSSVANDAGGMEAAVLSTVQSIHASPTKAVIVATGGGSQVGVPLSKDCVPRSERRSPAAGPSPRPTSSQGLSWLLSVPGASGTVLEAVVPYSRASLTDFLGREPAKYVSADTARDLALQAYRRAVRTHTRTPRCLAFLDPQRQC